MKAIDTALYTVLSADLAGTATGTLGQLGVTGVYRALAPQTATLPYIVYNEQAGTDQWTFNARTGKSTVYQVKAIDDGHSAANVSAMSDRLDALLNDAALSVSGWSCKRIRRESDIEYAETDEGVIYHHIGGLYRIDIG
jgi:hypothetical protein